jgi:predicted DNA-binding protein
MQTTDVAREKQLNIRLSAEESERIEALTAHYGINTAALIRMLVKREADSLGFVVEAPKPTKKKSSK